MNKKILVLYCNSYNFTDDRTGQIKEGVSFRYIFSDDLAPVVNSNGSKGYTIQKASLPLSSAPAFISVPGVYVCAMDIKDKGGQVTLVPVAVTYIGD